MGAILVAGMLLVILHRVDGGEVAVSPAHITSMHSRAGTHNKLITHGVHCIVWLDDGRILSVLEPCDVVTRLMRDATGGR
jgi:hypothetical protein